MSSDGEIKTPLEELEDYHTNSTIYLIREEHSIADVVRWCIEQTGYEEVEWVLKNEKK